MEIKEESQELKRVLGFWSIFAIAVGLVVASTTLAGDLNGFGMAGPAFLISLLVGFALNLFVVLSFSELATMFPKAGQIYEYTKDAFQKGKEVLSTGIGTTYWAMMGVVFAAEIAAGAWALHYSTGIGSLTSWVLFITITCLIINLLGIELSAWVEIALVVMMVGLRILVGILCYAGVTLAGPFRGELLQNFAPFGFAGIAAAIPLAFWAFVGLEFAVPLVEETINPEKTLPRGMIAGIICIFVMSIIMGFGILGVVDPVTQGDILIGDAPQIFVGKFLLGRIGILIMGIASFTATMGSVNVAFASIPRIAFAMAREGMWPKLFKWVHPRYRTPWPAIILTFILFTLGPILWSDVVWLIYAASFIWLLLYLWTHILVVKFKFTHRDITRPFKNHMAIPIIGAILIIWALYVSFLGAGNIILIGFGFIGLGFVYASIWVAVKNKKQLSHISTGTRNQLSK